MSGAAGSFGQDGWRVALVGATGTLGREVLSVLEEHRLPIREFAAFGSQRSTGEDVELAGEDVPVRSGEPALRGFDLALLCAPPAVSLDWVRHALHAEVPCIDCSGALASTPDVPLVLASAGGLDTALGVPAVATPTGPATSWGPVLAALEAGFGLRRVVGTVLRSASSFGRSGIEALSQETVALLSQREPPDPELFPAPVAFDCLPDPRSLAAPASDEPGAQLVRDLHRLIAGEPPIAVRFVQVPVFVGEGTALFVDTERSADLDALRATLEKAAGVSLWDTDEPGPTTRDATGRDDVLVSAPDGAWVGERTLALWLSADPVRLAAKNAVRIAEARLRLH